VRVVGARAVRRPCPRRACAAWAVSARHAVEPGVARRSDRDTVHGIKETKVPHGGVACSKNFLCFLRLVLPVLTGVRFQQVVSEPVLRIRVGNHAGQVSDSTATRPCEVVVPDSEKITP
jgi:hypothetical protein